MSCEICKDKNCLTNYMNGLCCCCNIKEVTDIPEREWNNYPEFFCDNCTLRRAIPFCPDCGSDNVYGISRIVGYFSRIENWNISKKEEQKDRQRGNYWSEEL